MEAAAMGVVAEGEVVMDAEEEVMGAEDTVVVVMGLEATEVAVTEVCVH